MDCRCIPHIDLPHASRLFTDYLYDFPKVRNFYTHDPFREESFAKAARAVQYGDDVRRQVVGVLTEQNGRFSASEKTLQNLTRLEKPGCLAVVTGQQVGLFTGPAFSIYKALTAIKLAAILTEKGLEAVPIFWLHTEDHDLAEVNHCFLQDREGNPQRLEYPEQASVPGAPVGTIQFSQAIAPLVESVSSLLPDSAFRDWLLEGITRSYRPAENFGSAFGRLLLHLFAGYGLIVLDPSDPRLHALSSRVFQIAVESATSITAELLERNRRLAEAGYPAQVRVTENSSLLFHHSGGRRLSLRLESGQFVTPDGLAFSPAELLAEMQRDPACLSPNVLLRPIVQDSLLPTVAYVGGSAEVAYFAQLSPLYQRMLGHMPVIYPRASFTLLEPHANRLLGKYDLTLLNVCEGKQALREKMAALFLPPELTDVFERATAGLDRSLEEVQQALARLDPTLAAAAENSGKKMRYQLSTLEHKASAAVQSRSEQVERDAQRLENSLYPERMLQERFYSGIGYLARYGPPLLARLYQHITLESKNHHAITV